MYKNILGLVILVSTPFLPSLSFAQELPNSSLLVNTQCKISHGHSVDDVSVGLSYYSLAQTYLVS